MNEDALAHRSIKVECECGGKYTIRHNRSPSWNKQELMRHTESVIHQYYVKHGRSYKTKSTAKIVKEYIKKHSDSIVMKDKKVMCLCSEGKPILLASFPFHINDSFTHKYYFACIEYQRVTGMLYRHEITEDELIEKYYVM